MTHIAAPSSFLYPKTLKKRYYMTWYVNKTYFDVWTPHAATVVITPTLESDEIDLLDRKHPPQGGPGVRKFVPLHFLIVQTPINQEMQKKKKNNFDTKILREYKPYCTMRGASLLRRVGVNYELNWN